METISQKTHTFTNITANNVNIVVNKNEVKVLFNTNNNAELKEFWSGCAETDAPRFYIDVDERKSTVCITDHANKIFVEITYSTFDFILLAGDNLKLTDSVVVSKVHANYDFLCTTYSYTIDKYYIIRISECIPISAERTVFHFPEHKNVL